VDLSKRVYKIRPKVGLEHLFLPAEKFSIQQHLKKLIIFAQILKKYIGYRNATHLLLIQTNRLK